MKQWFTLTSHLQRWIAFSTLFCLWLLSFKLLHVEHLPGLVEAVGNINYLQHQLQPQPMMDDILVVEVDEASINEYGRWPWDRSLIGSLIGKLSEAELIALDIIFSESSDAEEDAALALAISQSPTILGLFLRSDTQQILDPLQEIFVHSCAYSDWQGSSLPSSEFTSMEANLLMFHEVATNCALFTTQADADGIYRRYTLGYTFAGQTIPTLAPQMLRVSRQAEPHIEFSNASLDYFGYDQLLTHDWRFRLNFDKRINRLSALDVLQNKVDAALWKNRWVIIGVSESGIFDLRPTPLDDITPGVYLHAYAASNLKHNSAWDDRLRWTFILGAILIILGALAYQTTRAKRGVAYAFIVLLSFSINLLAFYQGIWLHLGLLLPLLILVFSTNELLLYGSVNYTNARLKTAFRGYVSGDLMQMILHDPAHLNLGGEQTELTVLFADLRNFTALSESMSPQELVTTLNQLFDPLTEAILDERGMLDKYIGDALMALFNAPLPLSNHAEHAFRSALRMIGAVEKFNLDNGTQLALGIGLNTGDAVVGNMGSTVRFSYTAMGDAVNLASRIEGLSKYFGQQILLSEQCYQQLSSEAQAHCLFIDQVKVKGRQEPTSIYAAHLHPLSNDIRQRYHLAWQLYAQGEFSKARSLFQHLLSDYPPTLLLLSRCRMFEQNPPEDWDGVFTMDSK